MKKIKKKAWVLAVCGAATGILAASPVSADSQTETSAAFATEDIHGEEYTEKIFEDADLTLVNVFAT